MIITSVKADGFRNLKSINFIPDERYNIISGKNAQGKTNLLEAMWIMTGCKSFRGSKEKDYISLEKNKMLCEICIQDSRRVQKISYELIKGASSSKNLSLNGVKIKGTSGLFDVFKCISFTPDDTEIVKGSPEKRRNFTDMAYSQLNPASVSHITRHSVIMNQRNALLKSIFQGNAKAQELDAWDRQASKEGAYISYMRHEYIKQLNETAKKLYSKITGENETLEIYYHSNVFREQDFENFSEINAEQRYYEKMREMTAYDIKTGCTHTGANRDDVIIKINKCSARDFGSQGQIKSIALVIKLAQAEIYSRKSREAPVVFLDDVMGELDESRQRLVFDIIKNMQVFITTCNESALLPEIKGRIIHIGNGEII